MDLVPCFPRDSGWAILCGALCVAGLRIHAPVVIGTVACTLTLFYLEHPPQSDSVAGEADAVSARVAVASHNPTRGDVHKNSLYREGIAEVAAAEVAAAESAAEGAQTSGATRYCQCAHPTQVRRSAESRARLLKACHSDFEL